MGIIFFLIAASTVVALIFLAAFVWAMRTGQFDDDRSPAVRILEPEGKVKRVREAMEERDVKEVDGHRSSTPSLQTPPSTTIPSALRTPHKHNTLHTSITTTA